MSLEEDELALKHLVLLPGLEGTGQLFGGFLTTLPPALTTTVVSYPTDRFLTCSELLELVSAAVPKTEPFVVLAESFSTPLALKYASTNPPNLAGVIICAGFARNPIGGWSRLAKAVSKPWFFTLKPPRFVLEYFLVGENAPSALIQRIRETLPLVRPEVLSCRVREVLECDASNDLARIISPIMYLRGLHDRLLSVSCHREILRIRPDVVLATIEAPHMLLQREPQKAANLIVAFLAKSR
jgi:pimeloyl-[acyl-carrier protein] methyl ester esterase